MGVKHDWMFGLNVFQILCPDCLSEGLRSHPNVFLLQKWQLAFILLTWRQVDNLQLSPCKLML